MTDRPVDDRYSPYEVVTRAEEFGLVETTVESDLGSCVARHRPDRTSGRATIFLHGAAGGWTTWTPMLQSARDGGTPIENPVLLDLPGWGDARITRDRSNVTVIAICTLVKSVAEELGYTEWDLVGHSLGGFVALHMASIWPGSVTSVAMVSGTTFSVIRSVEHPVRNVLELPWFVSLWQVMRFAAILGPVATSFVRALERIGVLRLVISPLFRHGLLVPRSVIRVTARDIRPVAFAAAAEVTRGYDARARWSAIQCPVRATKGDRDVFVNDRDFEELARILPSSTRTVIPDCGHFGNVERPGEVLAALGLPRGLDDDRSRTARTVEP